MQPPLLLLQGLIGTQVKEKGDRRLSGEEVVPSRPDLVVVVVLEVVEG
jgi:hypothetical protein